ncbi:MAG: hypothetical protein JST46_18525, partial [Bacteroidetes bacterium]|nr:hypothetical protein [Bacteroidota bacterium]
MDQSFSKLLNVRFFLLIVLFFAIETPNASAQKPGKKFKQGGKIQLNDSLTTFSQSDIFAFPNVNRIPYYYDAAKMEKLHAYQKAGPSQEYYDALRSYVAHFGITNFHENTAMLWELAKLSQTYGPKGESVLLYKLVLKH